MNVGTFTDNDFGKVNGVTTSLRTVLRHTPDDIRPRIYTASDLADDSLEYLSLKSPGMGIPFYREMRVYLPRAGAFLRAARRDRLDLIHLTRPGPVGLTARFVAWRTGLRLVGSFHTDLTAYTAQLSGSPRLGRLMEQYLRWCYGRCDRIMLPSESTRELLIRSGIDVTRIDLWRRGVDTDLFSPARRSLIHAIDLGPYSSERSPMTPRNVVRCTRNTECSRSGCSSRSWSASRLWLKCATGGRHHELGATLKAAVASGHVISPNRRAERFQEPTERVYVASTKPAPGPRPS